MPGIFTGVRAASCVQQVHDEPCDGAGTATKLWYAACRRSMPGRHLSSNRALSPLSSTTAHGMRMQHARRGGLAVHAGRDVDIADRAVSAVPYLVPLFDGLKYGAALFPYPSLGFPCSFSCWGNLQTQSLPSPTQARMLPCAQGASCLRSSQHLRGCCPRLIR